MTVDGTGAEEREAIMLASPWSRVQGEIEEPGMNAVKDSMLPTNLANVLSRFLIFC